jgi:hypothetical protein
VLHVHAEVTVQRDRVEGLAARLELLRYELEKQIGETVS